ncbi:DUF2125 domain-containing protein [Rhodoblastus acidophilus]|uniref:DUF2125 domain-containing protein n=1 Tax=Candidatus Rhodoblastus alkanivorans TaxID=2954117 RepID=A0ABS9Z169_9HYPH|nr:DUF2125 domain-containing protein [Candidatus Rhodoblastus alkanivorans]MCI4678549.1 DUF2125 domain-containing protein [Candidatus Rhodoblastus alkanivorans]MCI4681363.1 DUF2125 domain-containing protein [Candidatus Rhodoblastus alkanivorans]MDI4642411.1 DUF2125 domain-containing protein [Rhodoblastus acidophilus]
MARYRRPIIIGLIVLLCVGVGEFWLYAANRLGFYVHQPILGGQSLADLCQSSDIGGFPFRLKLSCTGLTAPVRVGGGVIYAGVEEAHGVASLFSPNHIVLTISSPLVIQRSNGAPVAKLRHDGMTLDVAWGLSGVAAMRLNATSLDWRPESPEAGVAVNVQNLAVEAVPQGGPDTPAGLRYDLVADGVTAPALQALLKDKAPGHFAASGEITPPPKPGRDWRAALEDWRKKSGALRIQHMEWRSGDLSLRLDGALSLDDNHRPAGRLNVAAHGAGPLLTRLGVPAAAQAPDLLGALLGKTTAANAGTGALKLPLTLANGQILMGPLRLPATLRPLY